MKKTLFYNGYQAPKCICIRCDFKHSVLTGSFGNEGLGEEHDISGNFFGEE